MKFTAIWSILLILASGYAYGQPCPGDSVYLNNVTLSVSGGVLPTGTTTALAIFVSTNNSSFVTTTPGATTSLLATALPAFLGDAQIVIGPNFETNIGESGSFSASIDECGRIEVSTPAASPASLTPSTHPLLIFPSVSTGAVNITGSAADLANANILVFDEAGRIVYSLHNEASTTLLLDLGHLASGFYFLQIRQAAKTTTQKIIISK
jgi:Secretion system C-terminal sorting domain